MSRMDVCGRGRKRLISNESPDGCGLRIGGGYDQLLQKAHMKSSFVMALRGSPVLHRLLCAAVWAGAFLFAGVFAPPAFAACQQITIPVTYISSWDSHGFENTVSIDESRYPDHLAGKGPFGDRYDRSRLMVSYNVLAFQIPLLTGVVANAEIRLQVRYLVSLGGTEIYQCGALADPHVKLTIYRRLGGQVYDNSEYGAIYGSGLTSISDSTATILTDSSFIQKVSAAAGATILVQGSVSSLDQDPIDPEYLYVDSASIVLTLADNAGPQIIAQPLSRMVNAGAAAEFHVTACGAVPLSYQWMLNGAALGDATNASLLLPNVADAQAGNYRVVLSNSVNVVTSTVAVLQISHFAPYFVTHPSGFSASAGETGHQLRGLAAGAPPPSYQWRLEGSNIPGATSNTLAFALLTPADAGHYTLVASNSSGSVTSNPALVTIAPFYLSGPYFTGNIFLDNPISISVNAYGAVLPTNWLWFHNDVVVPGATNDHISFIATPDTGGNYFAVGFSRYGSVTSSILSFVVVSQAPQFNSFLGGETVFIAGQANSLDGNAYGGPPPTYQWYRNGMLLPDQQGPILTLSNTLLSDAGSYSVVASNDIGMNTNGPILISVVPGYAYVNPSYNEAGAGYAVLFQSSFQGALPASYQWYYDAYNPMHSNSFVFQGIPLPGETNSNLLLTGLSTNQVGFYAVGISNAYGSVLSDPAALQVYNAAPQATVASVVTNRVGDFVWVNGYLSGAPPPACQWKFNGVDISGATNRILALSNVSTQHTGLYSLVVSNAFGTATSSYPASLIVISASPLDDWSCIAPSPQANPLSAVAFGNGRRVAVGENGAVLVSTNGQTWTGRHLGRGIHLHAIAFGNGAFVAVGHADVFYFDIPVIFTSIDGFSWTAEHLSASGRFSAIAFGNDRFVAVGAQETYGVSMALTSTNGANWQNHYLPGSLYSSPLAAITFGNERFVAVSDAASWLTASLFYSPDGVNWLTSNANTNRDFEAVATAGTSFIAAGDAGVIGRSSDGVNWTVGPINTPAPFKAVSFGNGVYVAAGDSGATFTSSDAVSWQPVTVPSGHDLSGLVFGGGQFTAVGDAGRILVSSNGQNWADQCLGPDTDLYGIAQGPSSFVAVGEGAILYSSDATNWTRLTSTRKLHGVTYGNGLFVAVGKNTAILTSPDGFNWTTRSVSSDGYLERVIWANSLFVAVGEAGLIVTSPDGISWTKLPAVTPSDLEGIAYGNGVYVAVGGYFPGDAVATVLTSADGTHWTEQFSVNYFGVRARAVTFAKNRFVMVGNDGLTATSTDGKTWSPYFIYYDNLRAVTYTAGKFVAVGNDGLVISSEEGGYWTINRCPASMNLRDVLPASDALLAVGSNGSIWQSGRLHPGIWGRMLPAGFELHLTSGLGAGCSIQASRDLRTWDQIFFYTNSPSAVFLDSAATGMSNRFYRILGL